MAITGEGRLTRSFQSALAYGLPLIALAAAIVLAYTALHKELEHSRLAFGAAVVAAVSSLLTAIGQHRREVTIDGLNEEIRKREEKILALTNTVNNNLTGGNSFAMVYFPVREGKRSMVIRHFGESPLRDIHIDVLTFLPEMKLLDRFVYPSLHPNAIEMIKPIEIDMGRSFCFQVSFSTANGSWFEIVKGVRSDDDIVFALRARTLDKILHTEIHPKFPRDENGEVDWSVGTVDISDAEPVKETVDESISRSLGMA